LAAVLNHHGTVRCLQQQGADINIKDDNGVSEFDDMTFSCKSCGEGTDIPIG